MGISWLTLGGHTSTITTLKYSCNNQNAKDLSQFDIIINVLINSFCIDLNTCVMVNCNYFSDVII